MTSRRTSLAVKVGAVTIGGKAPIVVQSMTNTDTADIDGTVAQVKALARAGSEIVRVTVNNDEAAAAVPHIRETSGRGLDIRTPLVGDFHFNGHKLLKAHPACARSPRQTAHQSGQCRPRQQARPAICRNDRDGLPVSRSRCASA